MSRGVGVVGGAILAHAVNIELGLLRADVPMLLLDHQAAEISYCLPPDGFGVMTRLQVFVESFQSMLSEPASDDIWAEMSSRFPDWTEEFWSERPVFPLLPLRIVTDRLDATPSSARRALASLVNRNLAVSLLLGFLHEGQRPSLHFGITREGLKHAVRWEVRLHHDANESNSSQTYPAPSSARQRAASNATHATRGTAFEDLRRAVLGEGRS